VKGLTDAGDSLPKVEIFAISGATFP